MLIMDMPDVPPQPTPIIMAAQNNQTKQTGQKSERIMGVCAAVDSLKYRNERGETYYRNQVEVSPESDAATYLERYEHRYGYRGLDENSLKITVLKEPKHGVLFPQEESKYEADIGYEGEDFASVLVESKGVKVKILYYFKIAQAEPPDFQSLMCGDRWTWKISTAPNTESTIVGFAGSQAPAWEPSPGSSASRRHLTNPESPQSTPVDRHNCVRWNSANVPVDQHSRA
jgi:hypothetical protein